MSKKADYSAEEWKAISGAPVAAGLLITLADTSGPVGFAKEALAVGYAITRSSASVNAPEIAKSIAENVRSGGGRPELPDVPTGDPAQAKDALMGAIRAAVQAVESKSPSEAERKGVAGVHRGDRFSRIEGRGLPRFRRGEGE